MTNKGKRAKINEILEKEEEIAMAGETLVRISRDEIEQARLTTELKNILDYQSGLVHAKREGQENSMKTFAQNALKKGIPIETIHDITGLDIEIIKNL